MGTNIKAGAGCLLRSALCGLASMCIAAPGPSFAGDVYALVIGVDDYAHINPLSGAVNDARDVSDALASIAARDVRVLMDRDATREAIFANWSELSDAAGTGDTLIFHYAGHGERQDAILEGHEKKDNMFLLAGFDGTRGRALGIASSTTRSGTCLQTEKEATVLFVADSCFAGGMTRSVDSRVPVGIRTPGVRLRASGNIPGGTGADDPVAERVRKLGEVDEDALSRVIWLYAQDKNKVTQEIAVDGARRGALSYAFAQALRGAGDRNGDGRLDVPELKRFVNRKVAQLSERRQRPEVNAGSADLSIALARSGPEGVRRRRSSPAAHPLRQRPGSVRARRRHGGEGRPVRRYRLRRCRSRADLQDGRRRRGARLVGQRCHARIETPGRRRQVASPRGAISTWRRPAIRSCRSTTVTGCTAIPRQ